MAANTMKNMYMLRFVVYVDGDHNGDGWWITGFLHECTDSRHYVYRMKTVDSLAILGQFVFLWFLFILVTECLTFS